MRARRLQLAEDTIESVVVDKSKVMEYLGSPRFEYEEVEERSGEPGVVTVCRRFMSS